METFPVAWAYTNATGIDCSVAVTPLKSHNFKQNIKKTDNSLQNLQTVRKPRYCNLNQKSENYKISSVFHEFSKLRNKNLKFIRKNK